MSEPLLQLDGLSIAFPQAGDGTRDVVTDVSFTLERGGTLGLVGESGSGKSMTALAVMGLVPSPGRVTRGMIRFDGQEITALSEDQLRPIRGARIAMIFQDPSSALNPVFTVGQQIAEALRLHRKISRRDAWRHAIAALAEVGIADPALRANAYPHQLSGGMRQRCMIAMALINEPDLLIADEPTTALDTTVQAQILDLIAQVQKRHNMAVLFISHNLAVVSQLAQDVAVMRHGHIIEHATAERVFAAPRHDYTRRLVAAATLPIRSTATPDSTTPLIMVKDLTKRFEVREPGVFGRHVGAVQALNGVSFTLAKGQTFAVVGESGCGKSTLAKTLLGLHARDAGTVTMSGQTVAPTAAARTPTLRRRLQMVFQDPYASLNPRLTAAQTIEEPLVIHRLGSVAERREKSAEAARAVGLEPAMLSRYPHAFSGGERQRIALARALVAEPEVIVADEPLSSLDVSIQAQIIDLLLSLKQRLALTYLLISHDLAVVAYLADQVAVMYLGRIVEMGPSESVFTMPQHPYTQLLIAASPRPVSGKGLPQAVFAGEPPSAITPPSGCPFHPRCPKAQEICHVERPALEEIELNQAAHLAACHFPGAL